MTTPLRWELKSFAALTTLELYEIMRLRAEVFVVEQNCVYQDCDGYDQSCRHLFAREGEEIAAYLRLVPAGVKYPDASIGRVVTSPRARGKGIGRALVKEALRLCDEEKIPGLRISAQAYLEKFYRELGFERVGEAYLEDGIPHVEMLRQPI
ncbi:MAG: GNAT family N-acetyltransferase [Proteobacteria bacterium]|nr:MAG: GNAT family N-acetyltransferase [Pseudomonadota bacterium]